MTKYIHSLLIPNYFMNFNLDLEITFAVVVSGFGLNVNQRTYSSGAYATEYYSCSHSLFRPGMSSEGCHCG